MFLKGLASIRVWGVTIKEYPVPCSLSLQQLNILTAVLLIKIKASDLVITCLLFLGFTLVGTESMLLLKAYLTLVITLSCIIESLFLNEKQNGQFLCYSKSQFQSNARLCKLSKSNSDILTH